MDKQDSTNQIKPNSIFEQLASIQHDIWSHWMKYLFSICPIGEDSSQNIEGVIIPDAFVKRWKRQMNTPYSELSEKEKESDREQVNKFLALITSKEWGQWCLDLDQTVEFKEGDMISRKEGVTDEDFDRTFKNIEINRKQIVQVVSRFMDSFNEEEVNAGFWPVLEIIEKEVEAWFEATAKVFKHCHNYKDVYESVQAAFSHEEHFVNTLNDTFKTRLGIPKGEEAKKLIEASNAKLQKQIDEEE